MVRIDSFSREITVPRILLVDDSAVDRGLFTELLQNEDAFQVTSCENGQAALKLMEETLPDIVLTDMRMPVMDGLELVKHGRHRFPSVPFILITGHGSEDLATKALKAGAAGYVPKSQCAESMSDTIHHVLSLKTSQQIDPRISTQTALIQYELRLENDETLIPGVQQLVHQYLPHCIQCDSVTLLQIEVALEHAISNAIYHGNLEFKQYAGVEFDAKSRLREARSMAKNPPYRDRRVSVVMRFQPTEARFVIKDEGDGFDVREISSLGFTHSLRGEKGQGLYLMWAFMDKVIFDNAGSSVTLIKRFSPEKPKFEEVSPAAPEETEKKTTSKAKTGDVKLVLVPIEGDGERLELYKDRMTFGRDPSCDVTLNSAAISQHHCLLYLHEGWWFIRDLRSKNGFRINGAKYDAHLLAPNAKLTIGPYTYHVEYLPHKLGAVGLTPPVSPF